MFISEIHYENEGADSGEFIEITGLAGTDLAGWQLGLYNGKDGRLYATQDLLGIIPLQSNGRGTLVFDAPLNGLQNGPADGIALISPTSQVREFLSYEGTVQALEGPALGLTSIDIGVAESDETLIGSSLQRINNAWVGPRPNTRGEVNEGNNHTIISGSSTEQQGKKLFTRKTQITIQGTTVQFQPFQPLIENRDWQLQTSGQFIGSDAPDLLWQNIKTGQLLLWEDENTRAHPLPTVNASEWAVVGTGFFDADTNEDLLWYDAATQQVAFWYMDGQGSISERASINLSSDVIAELQDYELQAGGDFDGDGLIDLFWVNGYGPIDAPPPGLQPRAKITSIINGEVTKADDFDSPEVLGTRLEAQEWDAYLYRVRKLNQPELAAYPFPSVRGIGDYNGDGRDDLAFVSGSLWLMNGLTSPEVIRFTS